MGFISNEFTSMHATTKSPKADDRNYYCNSKINTLCLTLDLYPLSLEPFLQLDTNGVGVIIAPSPHKIDVVRIM